jgi:glycosyltransferase involved in cell wall biosynthesis
MKNLLIISYSPLNRDPRIQRQIKTFQDSFNIETIGLTPANETILNHTAKYGKVSEKKITLQKALIIIKMFFGNYKELLYYWYLKPLYDYSYKKPDLIIANDWMGLYSACNLNDYFEWNAKIYFDSHEYFPKYRTSLYWKIREKPMIYYAFRSCRNKFDIMSTVCPSLARMYEKFFHFEPNTVRVITNAPDYEQDLEPNPVKEKIRIIHHGLVSYVRQMEKMVDIMDYLPEDKYELYFMLVLGEKDYYEQLVQRASKHNNIHFLPPVPFVQIPSFINQFDIGLFILNNNLISYKYALPNKFFEFVQARLAIAIGDSFEMKQYVQKYDLGVTADENSAEALAKEIMKLSKGDIMHYKLNAHKYARELSAETNMVELRKIADELLG